MIANRRPDFIEKLQTLISQNLILKTLNGIDCITDFDGMAVIQIVNPVTSLVKPTFNDLANMFWTHVLHSREGINAVNVVFDRNFENTNKRKARRSITSSLMRQSACLVFNPITVDNYAAFFNCTPVGRASDSMMAPT